MPHEIDQSTGKAAVFVTGEAAWHKLGTVIEKAATASTMTAKPASCSLRHWT